MKQRRRIFDKLTILIMIFTLVCSPLLASAAEEIVIEDPNPDSTPPVLQGLSISTTEIAVGESVTFTADASDDLSGIDEIRLSYKGPDTGKGISLNWNDTTKRYERTYIFSNYEGGEWVLENISLKDNKGNTILIVDESGGLGNLPGFRAMDLTPYTIQVTGGLEKEKTPPVFNSVALDPLGTQVTTNGRLKVSVDATDQGSGIGTVIANFVKPSGRSISIYLSYKQTTGLYEGTYTIDQFDEIGEWRLNYIYIRDKVGNTTTISHSINTSANGETREV